MLRNDENLLNLIKMCNIKHTALINEGVIMLSRLYYAKEQMVPFLESIRQDLIFAGYKEDYYYRDYLEYVVPQKP